LDFPEIFKAKLKESFMENPQKNDAGKKSLISIIKLFNAFLVST
jgi:hypothetical protein